MKIQDNRYTFHKSPYKTVTSYETAFVTAYNEMLSTAMDEIIQYIAQQTVKAIKRK